MLVIAVDKKDFSSGLFFYHLRILSTLTSPYANACDPQEDRVYSIKAPFLQLLRSIQGHSFNPTLPLGGGRGPQGNISGVAVFLLVMEGQGVDMTCRHFSFSPFSSGSRSSFHVVLESVYCGVCVLTMRS